MEITDEIPEWYGKDRDGGGSPIPFSRATLAEFCGKFGLTREKALAEIRRCKIYSCGPEYNMKMILSELEPSIIPLAEFDRYEAIIKAEHSTQITPAVVTDDSQVERIAQMQIRIVSCKSSDMGDDELCHTLFSEKYTNNEIAVHALGLTYRKRSNAISQTVFRLRKAYQRKLGNPTPP